MSRKYTKDNPYIFYDEYLDGIPIRKKKITSQDPEIDKWVEELEKNAKEFGLSCPKGTLTSGDSIPRVSFMPGGNIGKRAFLDGSFTADQLLALIIHMKKYQR